MGKSRATCCCVVICSKTPSSVNSYSLTCTLRSLSISIAPSGMPFATGRKRPYTLTASVLPSVVLPSDTRFDGMIAVAAVTEGAPPWREARGDQLGRSDADRDADCFYFVTADPWS